MKRAICVILCLFLLTNFVYASDSYVLSLEQAKQLAKDNNAQLDVIEASIAAGEISLESAKYLKATSKNSEVYFGDSQTPLIKKGYFVEAAQSNLKLLDMQMAQTKSKIDYDVTEKYYNYLLAKRLVEISQDAENLANDNYSTVSEYFNLGMVAQLDVENAKANAQNAEYTKNGYIRNMKLAEENLKISLNVSSDSELTLTDSISTPEYESDVEADIAAAMETRYDVTALKESAYLSKLNFDIVGIYNLSNTSSYNEAKSSSIQSEYNYTNNKRLIGLSIRSTYDNILTAAEKLELAQNDYRIKQLEYDVAKVKYDVGTITNSTLMQAQNMMSSSQLSLENAKLSYLLAVEKYKYEITIGL